MDGPVSRIPQIDTREAFIRKAISRTYYGGRQGAFSGI
jgi:hypothetical protein